MATKLRDTFTTPPRRPVLSPRPGGMVPQPSAVAGAMQKMSAATFGEPAAPGAPAPMTAPAAPTAQTLAPATAAVPTVAAPAPPTIPYGESVAGRLEGMLKSDSPLMKVAANTGMQVANRRGLVNSSMAAGHAQGEMIRQATPIASQDATLAASERIAKSQQAAEMERLKYSVGSQEKMQGKDIQSRETLAANEIASEEKRLGRQLTSQEKIAAESRALEKWQTTATLTAQEENLLTELQSRETMQGRELSAEEKRLKLELETRKGMQQAEFGQQKFLQTVEGQQRMAQLITQIKSSENMQAREIGAEMERLLTNNKAEKDRLNAQLASATALQQTEIAAQMERLDVSLEAEMERLTKAAGFDMSRLKEQGKIDIARDAAQAKNATELAQVQGQIQSQLQAQGNTQQIQRMGVELANQLELGEQEQKDMLGRIAAQGNQDVRRLVEAANQERATLKMSLASQDRQALSNSMVNIFQVEQQLRAALLGNEGIPAAERAAYEKAITALGDPIRKYVGQLFGSAPGTPPPTLPPSAGGGMVPTPLPSTGTTSGGGGMMPGVTSQ